MKDEEKDKINSNLKLQDRRITRSEILGTRYAMGEEIPSVKRRRSTHRFNPAGRALAQGCEGKTFRRKAASLRVLER